jgi:hypothetical protein
VFTAPTDHRAARPRLPRHQRADKHPAVDNLAQLGGRADSPTFSATAKSSLDTRNENSHHPVIAASYCRKLLRRRDKVASFSWQKILTPKGGSFFPASRLDGSRRSL